MDCAGVAGQADINGPIPLTGRARGSQKDANDHGRQAT